MKEIKEVAALGLLKSIMVDPSDLMGFIPGYCERPQKNCRALEKDHCIFSNHRQGPGEQYSKKFRVANIVPLF